MTFSTTNIFHLENVFIAFNVVGFSDRIVKPFCVSLKLMKFPLYKQRFQLLTETAPLQVPAWSVSALWVLIS